MWQTGNRNSNAPTEVIFLTIVPQKTYFGLTIWWINSRGELIHYLEKRELEKRGFSKQTTLLDFSQLRIPIQGTK